MNAIFLGGDIRQKFACDYLVANGIESEYIPTFKNTDSIKTKIDNATIVALPIPITRDRVHLNMCDNNIELVDITKLFDDKSIVFGGQFSNELREYFLLNNYNYIDYFDIESFQIQNALLTAEGAIYYAKQRVNKSIYGSEIAILGFGRIGKILAYLLHCQGAKITVCARKETDFIWCKLIGFNGVRIKISGNVSNLNLINNRYDLIFNTIPHHIMDEQFVQSKNKDSIIIDLASSPFGIDDTILKKHNLNYYRELGIPGRYAPESAGAIIGKTILKNILIKED